MIVLFFMKLVHLKIIKNIIININKYKYNNKYKKILKLFEEFRNFGKLLIKEIKRLIKKLINLLINGIL